MIKWGMAAAALGLGAVALAAPVQSGLQKGEHLTPFDVVDVSGPAKGQQLCYV
jgi:hypothetical protein